MSYNATVYNIMIASPSDVPSERSIIRDVIYEWNAAHSKPRNIVLLPTGWDSHSYPEMGKPPQDVINSQVLDKCDMLIGVFWTRLGTTTENYASGTVEEIERKINSGKPVMIYFSSQPVELDSVDPKEVEEVKKFKESCKTRGLFNSYDSHADFRQKFSLHLQLIINDHEQFKSLQPDQFNEIIESAINIPELTREARIMLKEASQDSHGTIMFVRYIGGTDIGTNNKNFTQSNDPREVVKWESSLNELVDRKLLVARGHKGEIFEITNLGYQIADMIAL
jgi:hypothetical protein